MGVWVNRVTAVNQFEMSCSKAVLSDGPISFCCVLVYEETVGHSVAKDFADETSPQQVFLWAASMDPDTHADELLWTGYVSLI